MEFSNIVVKPFLRAINHARWVSMRSACILVVSKEAGYGSKRSTKINFQFASKASYIYTFQLKQNISDFK